MSPTALARNLDVLQIPVKELRALVVSHGHADHHGGLEALFRRHGRRELPLVIHPEAWKERKIVFPTGSEVRLPPRVGATSKPRASSCTRSLHKRCSSTRPCSSPDRLSATRRLAGFIGGVHLTGGIFEPIIKPTVDAFVAAGVGRVLPAHCTGWKAVHQLARALPNAFVQPAVGTVTTF